MINDAIDELKSKGIFEISQIADSHLNQQLIDMWLNISSILQQGYIDLENDHIAIIFDSTSKGEWPPKEGLTWPGYKQRTEHGNLIWKTVKNFSTTLGDFFYIELQQPIKTVEKFFYPTDTFLKHHSDILNTYSIKQENLLRTYFPNHKPTFSSLTYMAGNSFLPLHTDGPYSLHTARIVHVIENTRDHTIFVNGIRYTFEAGSSYLFNAFLPHEIKKSRGHRLTISSCIMPNS